MTYASIDPQVLGYLGRALSFEMSAIQQYLSGAEILKLRGFDELSEKFRTEAQEEMAHAERIIGRMMVLGGSPSGTQLRPAILGNSLPEIIAVVHSLETEIVKFYQGAVNYCAHIGDFDNRLFFEKLLQEEKEHASEITAWYQTGLTPKELSTKLI